MSVGDIKDKAVVADLYELGGRIEEEDDLKKEKIKVYSEGLIENINSYEIKETSSHSKVVTYKKLETGIKAYSQKLTGSRTAWQNFFSFFYKSKQEKVLDKAFKKIQKNLAGAKKLDPFKDSTRFQNDVTYGIQQEDHRIRSTAARLLGKTKVSSEQLEGMSFSQAQVHQRQLLDDFRGGIETKDSGKLEWGKEEKTALDKVHHEMEKMGEFFNLTDQMIEKRGNQVTFKWNDEFALFLKSEAQKLKPSESIVIPGGTREHAILYEIKKQDNGKFTLTVINTGEGNEYIANPQKSGLGNFLTAIGRELKQEALGKTSDWQIKDLSLDAVSEPKLWKDLLAFSSEKKPTSEVYKYLFTKFGNQMSASGHTHALQTNGTCTWDSILSWMETRLPPALFHAYQVHQTKTGLRDLSDLMASSTLTSRVRDLHATSGLANAGYHGKKVLELVKNSGNTTLKARQKLLKEKLPIKKEGVIQKLTSKFTVAFPSKLSKKTEQVVIKPLEEEAELAKSMRIYEELAKS